MRNVNARNVAVALSASLAFLLVQVAHPTLGNPAAGGDTVVAVAPEPLLSDLVTDLHTRVTNNSVVAKFWMHTGDKQQNGCGFFFLVDGYSGGRAQDWFPSIRTQKCANNEYRMRMTSQSAAYENTVRLGNDQVKKIEVHADGWYNTYVKTMCFGLGSNTIIRGPRVFCVNADLLKACKAATARWSDINIEFNEIMLTRTTRGIHKIIFNDIENLVAAYETIGGVVETGYAANLICDKIELIRGGDSNDSSVCPAFLIVPPTPPATQISFKSQDINPYGCGRSVGSK